MIKLVAILCSLAAPDDCRDVTVTDNVTMSECTISAVRDLPEWSTQYPAYELRGWRCLAGAKATERGA